MVITQLDTGYRMAPLSANQFASSVENSEGHLTVSSSHVDITMSLLAADMTDVLHQKRDAYTEVPVKTEDDQHSAVLPINHREGYPNVPFAVLQIHRKKPVILLPDAIQTQLGKRDQLHLLMRCNDEPLFTVQQAGLLHEGSDVLTDKVHLYPLWNQGGEVSSLVGPDRRPIALPGQTLAMPELPLELEAIIFASRRSTNKVKPIAGFKVNVSRETEPESTNAESAVPEADSA